MIQTVSMAGSIWIRNSSRMQLILSCSLMTFLDSPLDTSHVPIIRVAVYILPSLASRVMPTSASLRLQRNSRLQSASATGSWSAPVRGSPLQSGEPHLPVSVAVYSIPPKPRHENNPFSPVAPRSNPCGCACGICPPCSSYSLRPHSSPVAPSKSGVTPLWLDSHDFSAVVSHSIP